MKSKIRNLYTKHFTEQCVARNSSSWPKPCWIKIWGGFQVMRCESSPLSQLILPIMMSSRQGIGARSLWFGGLRTMAVPGIGKLGIAKRLQSLYLNWSLVPPQNREIGGSDKMATSGLIHIQIANPWVTTLSERDQKVLFFFPSTQLK